MILKSLLRYSKYVISIEYSKSYEYAITNLPLKYDVKCYLQFLPQNKGNISPKKQATMILVFISRDAIGKFKLFIWMNGNVKLWRVPFKINSWNGLNSTQLSPKTNAIWPHISANTIFLWLTFHATNSVYLLALFRILLINWFVSLISLHLAKCGIRVLNFLLIFYLFSYFMKRWSWWSSVRL